MNRHPFDLTAFVWGIGFLVASAVVMLREWADVTPDVKWVLPAALIVADQLHVRDVDRSFLVHDAALGTATLGVRHLRVLDRTVHTFDDDHVTFGDDLQHLSLGAAVLAGDDQDLVALANLCHD